MATPTRSSALLAGLFSIVAAQALAAGTVSGCAAGWSDNGGGICEMILDYNGTLATIGTVQHVTVPPNVTFMTMIVAGAQGEGSADTGDGSPAAGGKGGRQTGTIAVVSGDVLNVYVGEAGVTVPHTPTHGWHLPDPNNPGAYFDSGAFGGGGLSSSNYGGFGGGGSFVFDSQPVPNAGGAIGNLLIAAGGGGGAGYDGNQFVSHGGTGPQLSVGGAGSGATAAAPGVAVGLQPGWGGTGYPPGAGEGATLAAGGLGGVPAIPPNYIFGQQPGGPGAGPATLPDPANPTYTALYLGYGGNSVKGTCCYYYGFGGAGGGGFYGGGAGGTIDGDLEGGGGGGGSGFIVASATATLAESGVKTGDGRVILRYEIPAVPTVGGIAPPSGPPGTSILVSGAHFTGVKQVALNGMPMMFVADSPTQIHATVPPGATSGTVSVTNPLGTGTSVAAFTVEAVPVQLAVGLGGSGTGTVSSDLPGIVCGAVCTANFAAGSVVTLTAAPAMGMSFMGWLGDCTGTAPCQVTLNAAGGVSATFAPATVLPQLDIDGNAAYDALTDGLLMIRYLFGLTGPALTNGAIGGGAARTTPADIQLQLDNLKPLLDVDGNGQADALTDGLILIRYLFGLRGSSLIASAVGPGARRLLAADIETYIQSLLP